MWYDDEEAIEQFKVWLQKPEWTKKEAVLLLAGILPDDKWTPYKWVSTPFSDKFVACQYQGQYDHEIEQAESLINSALHEIMLDESGEQTSHDAGAPLWWLQFFCNEGILNKPTAWRILRENGVDLHPQENSSVVKYYRKWATKERWSFYNTVALLCRERTDETNCGLGAPDLLFGSSTYCGLSGSAFYGKYSVDDVSAKLRETIASKAIDFIEVERYSHVERRIKPSDAINWAKSKGYDYPELLLEALGCKLSTTKSNKGRNKRGCKDEIEKEFNRRAHTGLLSQTWDDEIEYLKQFAQGHGETYTPEGLKNIIKKKMFDDAKKRKK
jgi:hypothetical protein